MLLLNRQKRSVKRLELFFEFLNEIVCSTFFRCPEVFNFLLLFTKTLFDCLDVLFLEVKLLLIEFKIGLTLTYSIFEIEFA